MPIRKLAFALTVLATPALADQAGVRLLQFDAPHHGKDIAAAVWYPTDGPGREITFGENPVFYGVNVIEAAPIAEGRHPLVLMSHGMGGTIRSLAWLSAGLAERGAIVVSVNHPNSTWRDLDLAEGIRHWSRVHDLSVALDWALADRELSVHLDDTRLMAAGFSFGGWTALSMGGLRFNHAGFVTACETHGAAIVLCDELLSEAVNLQALDATVWNRDYRDQRITHVAAIDPGLIWGIEPDDVTGVQERVTLIGLGEADDRLLATDFDTSGLADLIPFARIERLVPATHFTALPLCKPDAEIILREEGDDPVCTDPKGTDRAAIHRAIIDRIASDLGI